MILNLNPHRDYTVTNIKGKTFVIESKDQPFTEILESEVTKLKQLIQQKPQLKKYVNDTFQELKKFWSNEIKNLNRKHLSFALILAPVTAVTPEIPPELIKVIITIIAVLAVIGVGGAMICGMLSGIWKMVNGKEKADKWNQDIIKGLTTVLGTPIVVLLIVTVFALLFSHLPVFKPVLEPVKVFFQNQ
jgi:hypothetical protein